MSREDARPSQRCTGLKTLLADHESRQEEVEGGSHDVSGPWIEVTIIPVVRLAIASLKESLWRGEILVCGGEDRSAKDRILLCGGADTSGTEPDHALWWKRDVSLHWRTQDVRAVWRHCLWKCTGVQLESDLAAGLDRHRMSVWSVRHCLYGNASCRVLPVTPTIRVASSSTICLWELTVACAWQSDMQSLPKASRKMLKQEIATEYAFLDRTSLLILADDWFGKLVEKSLLG